MPGENSPAATVQWPVQSGPVPPLAAFYSPRPETGFTAGGPSDSPAPPNCRVNNS